MDNSGFGFRRDILPLNVIDNIWKGLYDFVTLSVMLLYADDFDTWW